MSIKDMIWRNRNEVPVRHQSGNEVISLRNDMNRLFDEFFGEFGLSPITSENRLASFLPQVDVSETENEIRVTAELPGMEEKDIEVTLDESALTITGEKKMEKEEKTAQSYHLERAFGTFQRIIPLPNQVEAAKIKAVFKKGVLQVTLPKIKEEKPLKKKVEIKTE